MYYLHSAAILVDHFLTEFVAPRFCDNWRDFNREWLTVSDSSWVSFHVVCWGIFCKQKYASRATPQKESFIESILLAHYTIFLYFFLPNACSPFLSARLNIAHARISVGMQEFHLENILILYFEILTINFVKYTFHWVFSRMHALWFDS